MALAEMMNGQQTTRRSIGEVRQAGRHAADLLAEAERMRALAVAELVEFNAINGHAADGYLTPQRHLIHRAGIAEGEAKRLIRLVRFCGQHPHVADQLAAGLITVEHAEELRTLANHVDTNEFTAALPDLLHSAVGVELSVFVDRIRVWQWRVQPDTTDDDLDTSYDNRSLTMQPGLFGGMKGTFQLDPAGAATVANALHTRPDPTNTLEGPRTLAQRSADRLVELAGHIDDQAYPTLHNDPVGDSGRDGVESDSDGARQTTRSTVDVLIDLPTLLSIDFNLDDHRDPEGNVDWDSIQASFALTGQTPRRVLQQFFCDASWRTLITAGRSTILDYTHAKPEINPTQRRAVQRRDRHCQFSGCDRHWTWCDIHHLRAKDDGGWDLLDNLTLLCRRHHTMIHQQGWQLWRDTNGRIQTTTPESRGWWHDERQPATQPPLTTRTTMFGSPPRCPESAQPALSLSSM